MRGVPPERCTTTRPDLPVLLATGSERPLVELLEARRSFDLGAAPALTR